MQGLINTVSRGKRFAAFFQLGHTGLSLLQLVGGFGSLLCLLPGSRVFQRLPVVVKLLTVLGQLLLPFADPFCLLLQILQTLQLAGQFFPLGQCLGNQTVGTVGTAAVFQVFQRLTQGIGSTGLVTGGDKGIQPSPEGFVLGHGQIRQFQKTGSGEYALFHT